MTTAPAVRTEPCVRRLPGQEQDDPGRDDRRREPPGGVEQQLVHPATQPFGGPGPITSEGRGACRAAPSGRGLRDPAGESLALSRSAANATDGSHDGKRYRKLRRLRGPGSRVGRPVDAVRPASGCAVPREPRGALGGRSAAGGPDRGDGRTRSYPSRPPRRSPDGRRPVARDGRPVWLHSRYEPIEEAKKLIDALTRQDASRFTFRASAWAITSSAVRPGRRRSVFCVFEPDLRCCASRSSIATSPGSSKAGECCSSRRPDKADLFTRLTPQRR